MIVKYTPPHCRVVLPESEPVMLVISIPVGGHGSFDVKEQEDWELEEEPTPNPLPPIEVKNVWNKQW